MRDQRRLVDEDLLWAELLRTYVDTGLRPFDPGSIAARAVAAGNAEGPLRWWLPLTRPQGRQLALALVLGLLVVGAAILVAAALRVEPRPVPGRIAIAAGDEIHLLDAEGTNHKVLPSTGHDSFPVWSPDGTRIAYTDHLNQRGVWVVNVDGTGAHTVTDGYRSAEPVVWSPDGRQIAFIGSRDAPQERGLFIAMADGTKVVRVAGAAADGELFRLGWAPDGSLISFVVLDEGNATLHVVDPRTGDTTRVTESRLAWEGETAPPSWSGDSSRLLYSVQSPARVGVAMAQRGPSGWTEQFVVSSRTGSSLSPQWIDTDRFIYVRSRQQLRVAYANGAAEREIWRGRFSQSSAACIAPDGSRVAIGVEEWDATSDLLIVSIDAPIEPRRILVGNLDHGGPVCSWQAVQR